MNIMPNHAMRTHLAAATAALSLLTASSQSVAQVPASENCSEISIQTPSGWWLRIFPDGSARLGFGSTAGDDVSLARETFRFSKIHSELAALDFDGAGLSRDPAVAFHERGASSTQARSTKQHQPLEKLFNAARAAAKNFDNTRLRQLWASKPPLPKVPPAN